MYWQLVSCHVCFSLPTIYLRHGWNFSLKNLRLDKVYVDRDLALTLNELLLPSSESGWNLRQQIHGSQRIEQNLKKRKQEVGIVQLGIDSTDGSQMSALAIS